MVTYSFGSSGGYLIPAPSSYNIEPTKAVEPPFESPVPRSLGAAIPIVVGTGVVNGIWFIGGVTQFPHTEYETQYSSPLTGGQTGSRNSWITSTSGGS